ncbi:MAG TPA: hypothetical protein DCQ26_13655 [Marinilabiliales bacterium]|jgi:predicted transcriptional regulator|nr:MAG: hypothetical protein A2W95_18755 [Bacteroidetes bacterium GWA2_40_14]OFX60825.1 MAG: hypothetical protein A2W84_14975 [Bacteroidetes bacterium GWC2_40_13]OFX71445.1 MAG: hypothetical protein A2W96_13070 [Bacteroidetes bacterium GWD2_40_43]OFX92694.1 MAG: hypothetical protein A2W97_08815 [Bacteroidetes bacterium GWE2_40_63]OFY17599.1 MAG: hypothetical protein A2W88_10895 [Bacteroidetes bacterium GWF2_40_13]OFZ28052.1 MAG: hypothetical protein A2437_04070 [Bacteroidetes bacterium RIFOXYC
MDIHAILKLLNGTLVAGQLDNTTGFENAFASDLMSDVLTVDADNTLLITGLANIQTIRTAEMSDIECIIVARNKRATEEMIELANHSHICIIETPFSVFRVAGLLFQYGLKPLY